MEQISNDILNEYGFIAFLLLIVLLGLYRLAKSFLVRYLELIEEKDKAFIQKVGEIVLEIKNGGATSKQEHEKTRELINENHDKVIQLIRGN